MRPLALGLLVAWLPAQAVDFDRAVAAGLPDSAAAESALQHFLRIAPGPDRDDRLAGSIVVAYRAGNLLQGCRLFRAAREANRTDRDSVPTYLRCLAALGDGHEFVTQARAARVDDPTAFAGVLAADEALLLPSADDLLRSGSTAEGLWLFDALASGLPAHASRFANLALALRHTADLVGAKHAYERALELAPGDPWTWNDYGLLLRVSGDQAGARAAFLRSLALDAKLGEGPSITNLVLDGVLMSAVVDPLAWAEQALATRPSAALLRRAVIDLVLRRAGKPVLQQQPDNRARGR